MLIKYCKIPCKNLDKALLFLRNNRETKGILTENLKTLTSSNYPPPQYFFMKLRTCFLLSNVCKRDFFSFV